jgi:hypothetical protein
MSMLQDYLAGLSCCRLDIRAGADLTTEKIRPRMVSLPDPSPIINRPPFAKRRRFKAI